MYVQSTVVTWTTGAAYTSGITASTARHRATIPIDLFHRVKAKDRHRLLVFVYLILSVDFRGKLPSPRVLERASAKKILVAPCLTCSWILVKEAYSPAHGVPFMIWAQYY